jgi:hypothetical protein
MVSPPYKRGLFFFLRPKSPIWENSKNEMEDFETFFNPFSLFIILSKQNIKY